MIPHLIHPQTIVVKPMDSNETIVDDVFREPMRQPVYSTETTFLAQVEWMSNLDPMVVPSGIVEGMKGYLVARDFDFSALSYTPHRNDKIVQIGVRTGLLYSIEIIEPSGHRRDRDRPELWILWFADHKPRHARGNWIGQS